MNMRIAGITACIAAVLAIGLRVADFLFFFDKNSGFFTNCELLTLISILLCVVVLIIRIVIAVRQKIQISSYKEGRNIPLGVVNIISALGLSAGSWLIFNAYTRDMISTQNNTDTTLVSSNVLGAPDLRPVLIGVCIVFALYSIFSGIIYCMGKDKIFTKWQVLELVPAVWGLVFVPYMFINHSVSVFQAENAVLLIGACSVLLFQIAKAAYVSDVIKGRACQNRVKIFSSIAIALGFSYCVSNLILYILGVSYPFSIPIEIQVIMLFAYIQVPAFMILSKSELRDITEFGMPYRGRRFKNM